MPHGGEISLMSSLVDRGLLNTRNAVPLLQAEMSELPLCEAMAFHTNLAAGWRRQRPLESYEESMTKVIPSVGRTQRDELDNLQTGGQHYLLFCTIG